MSYHNSLKEKHSEDRANTIKLVHEAIQTIKDIEGNKGVITAKKILMYSDLSRSVLYKEHILKVWNQKLWEEKYAIKNSIETKYQEENEKMLKAAKLEIEELTVKLGKATNVINNLKKELEFQKNRIKVYKADIDDEKLINQKLLGECQRLANEFKARGFEI